MHRCIDSPHYFVLIHPSVEQPEPREQGKSEGKT